ncbi:MAG: hypothetical protein IPO92_22205 [Saprospiraceae bacterium]|nr:hypothetical protein [Saprospiraceae bacterium]
METIIIKSADSTTTQKIKDFLKELKVTYKTESKKGKEKPYDAAFVKRYWSVGRVPNKETLLPMMKNCEKICLGNETPMTGSGHKKRMIIRRSI